MKPFDASKHICIGIDVDFRWRDVANPFCNFGAVDFGSDPAVVSARKKRYLY